MAMTFMRSTRDVLVLAVVAASCSTPADLPQVRFSNAAPVTVVDDRRNVAERPDVSRAMVSVDYYDRAFAGPMLRRLSLPEKHRARGVNALDEVPDSTWFTNRIGIREMSPEEITRGPLQDEGPEPHKPWTVHSTKTGTEIGFIVTDATGVKYGINFDTPEWPELETGTAIVVNRLLWAFGNNVPADRIAYVRADELVLAPDAEIKDLRGKTTGRLDRSELDRRLAQVWHTPDGRYRVVASRWLDGIPLGGPTPSGVRRGDPNDRIAHEDRRDLRGLYPLFAWVDHVDLAESNFLDMWVTTPADQGRRYVMHYKLDFGKSMGTMAATNRDPRIGYAYLFDSKTSNESLFTLGMAPRRWGQHFAPPLTGVAPTFVANGFDPGAWRPALPYAPFDAGDRFDMFWGAKIIGRFTRAQIRAAVEAGQFSDPRTVEYLTDTLVARQRATEEYWYTRVNPLDRFAMRGTALCFEDLAIARNFAPAARTRYDFESYDRAGRRLGAIATGARPGGMGCADIATLTGDGDGYTIVKVTTRRPSFAESTLVHLARDPSSGAVRVIGVWRM